MITNRMIPAVRVYLAQVMSRKYKLTQQEIAKKLGIAQVAVSKYVNMKYSSSVAKARADVSRQMDAHFVSQIMKSRSPGEVNRKIERFCADSITA